MRPGDPQDHCPTVTIPTVRQMQRERMGLQEISTRLNITKRAIDYALWRHIDIADENLSPIVPARPEPMF